MRQRLNYIPVTWFYETPFLKWAAAKPSRVIGYFCVILLAAIGVLVGGAITGRTMLSVLGIAATLGIAVEAAIYVPRALRAIRSNSESN
jgi:hypothetical protein